MSEIDQTAMAACRAHWKSIAKPLYSLGLLEDAIEKIAGIQGRADVRIDRRCVLVFCADNGVVAEGVTQTGQEVTALVAKSLARGTGNVCAMAKAARCDVRVVDVGMATRENYPNVLCRKIACGTKNFAEAPAMTPEECRAAIDVGRELALSMKTAGYDILLTGEMGIGNTTTSSAVASVLLSRPVEEMTGRGAGLSDAGLSRKISVIRHAIALHAPAPDDPFDVLCKLGGFDIAAMAGVFLGAAEARVPVVIDGFISGVSALIAARLCPESKAYMLASHVSREPAGRLPIDALGLAPVLCAEMALGEGTGAVALLPLLDLALCVYRQSGTFESVGIAPYESLSEARV